MVWLRRGGAQYGKVTSNVCSKHTHSRHHLVSLNWIDCCIAALRLLSTLYKSISRCSSGLGLLPFSLLLQLLPWWQHIWSKAQWEQFSHCPYDVFALLVEHEDRCLQCQELSQELPAHSTGRAEVINVGSHTNSFERAQLVTLDYSGTESNALGASSDRVGSILDVCANDDGGFGRRRLV